MRKTTGISLMLLIFLTLSLVTFSLLSLSGAKADEKLSQEAADRTKNYYQAETRAYQVLSVIDSLLADGLTECEISDTPEESWLILCQTIPEKFTGAWAKSAEALQSFNSGYEFSDDTPVLSWDTGSGTLSFDTTINENQILHAELLLSFPEEEEDSLYIVAAWQTVNTQDWNADQSLKVYQR